jgi:protein-disulfide isomerase
MGATRSIHQRLVVYTLVVIVFVNAVIFSVIKLQPPHQLNIEVSKGLTFGYPKAPVEIVLFEDVLCSNCRWFMSEIFPMIQRDFIQTGKAKFTIIPLAFMEGSRELTNAMICVYQHDPAKFFPFLHEVFEEVDDYSEEELIKAVQRVGKLPYRSIRTCIKQDRYFPLLKENYDLGKQLMGDSFGTPTLFIDGVMTPYHSYHLIALRIEKGAGSDI